MQKLLFLNHMVFFKVLNSFLLVYSYKIQIFICKVLLYLVEEKEQRTCILYKCYLKIPVSLIFSYKN